MNVPYDLAPEGEVPGLVAGDGTLAEQSGPVTAAFLFVDLVGSTELRHHLGDDLNDSVEQSYMAVLRSAVTRAGGDEARSMGDGLMVAFRGTVTNAVACAVDMQRSIARLGRRDPLMRLQIRVGISVGEVTPPGDGDWSGRPIVEAARLVARALPNTILVTDVVRILVGIRGGYDFVPVGPMELKGFPAPVECCTVGWEPDPELTTLPLPAGLVPPAIPRLVGRADDLATLARPLGAALEERSRILAVRGEPGSGRRRLVAEFARRVHEEGTATVLFGHCEGSSAGGALGIVDALHWWVAAAPVDTVRHVIGADGKRMGSLVPSVRSKVPELLDIGGELIDRAGRVAVLASMLQGVASVGPIVLVLDGSSGLDQDTVEVLEAACARTGLLGLVVVDAEETQLAGTGVEQFELSPLDSSSVRALLLETSMCESSDLTLELVDELVRETGGLPGAVLDAAVRLSARLTDAGAEGSRSQVLRAAVTSPCPYRGLLSYREGDAAQFFGREEELAALLTRVGMEPLVAVVGASGSGKSSLIHAGLVPALHRGVLPGSREWGVVLLHPGQRPLVELATAIAGRVGLDTGEFLSRLEGSSGALGQAIDDAGPDVPHLVIVIDQFEEVFTMCADASERDRFVGNLLTSTRAQRVSVLLAMRGDFVGQCASVEGLGSAVSGGAFLLGPMREDGIRDLITRPAEGAGLTVEAGLVELMLRDVEGEPGALPLLSHALYETWRRRERRVLTIEGYRSCGGVRAAIAATADAEFARSNPIDQAITPEIFIRLTELGEGTEDTRRRVDRASLESVAPPVAAIVDRLIDARLLTADGDQVEVAHEALIREWPRLREWLDADRDRLRVLRHLTRASAEWEARERDDADLYRGARLTAALAAGADGHLSGTERSFLQTSEALADREHEAEEQRVREREGQNQRLRRMLVLLAVALVVAVVGFGLTAVQTRRASDNAAEARVRSRDADFQRIVSQSADLLPTDRRLGILLAAEAARLRPGPVSSGALLRVLQRTQGFLGAIDVERTPSAVVATGKNRVAVIDRDAGITFVGTDDTDGPAPRQRLGTAPRRPVAMVVASRVGDDASDRSPVVVVRPDTGHLFRVDPRTHRIIGDSIAVGAGATAVAVHPGSSEMAVASGGRISRWTAAGKQVGSSLVAGAKDVQGLSYVPGSKDLLILRPGVLERIDPATSTVVARWTTGAAVSTSGAAAALVIDPASARAAVFDPSTRTLLGVDLDGAVRFHRPLASISDRVQLSYSPDGSTLVRVDDRGQITAVDDATGADLRVVGQTQIGRLASLRYVGSHRLVAASASEPAVEVWSDDLSSPIATHIEGPAMAPVEFSPDGAQLLTQTGTAADFSVWDARTGEPIRESIEVMGAAFAGPGELGVLLDAATTSVIDIRSGRALGPPLALPAQLTRARNGPRRSVLAFTDGHVEVHDRVKGRMERSFKTDGATLMALRADEGAVAVAATDGTAAIYDTNTGKPLLEGLEGITDLAFDPTGRRLFVSTADGRIEARDTKTGALVGPDFTASPTPSAGIRVDCCGRWLGAVDFAGGLRLFDLRSGRQLGDQFQVTPDAAWTGALAPKGDRAAIQTDAGVDVYDLKRTSWLAAACRLAGRDLTGAERATYLPNTESTGATCPG